MGAATRNQQAASPSSNAKSAHCGAVQPGAPTSAVAGGDRSPALPRLTEQRRGQQRRRQRDVGDQPGHLLPCPGEREEDADEPDGKKRLEDEARSGRCPADPNQQSPHAGDDRRGDPKEHGDELVLWHEQQVVEPGLLAAAEVVLTQPVEERAVGRDGAGGEPVEIGEERREEDREDHQSRQ